MAGHPSVKKRQKELARKERQAEKLQKRDQRRADGSVDGKSPADEFAGLTVQLGADGLPVLDEDGRPILVPIDPGVATSEGEHAPAAPAATEK